MKTFIISSLTALSVFMMGCSSNDLSKQIAGDWTLTSYVNDSEEVELTECDAKTKWSFTNEGTEPLADGTQVMKLVATAPDNCEYFGFEASWTVVDGQLFISTSRIGGMGGSSLAGLMEVVEITPNKMVVTMMKKKLTFTR